MKIKVSLDSNRDKELISDLISNYITHNSLQWISLLKIWLGMRNKKSVRCIFFQSDILPFNKGKRTLFFISLRPQQQAKITFIVFKIIAMLFWNFKSWYLFWELWFDSCFYMLRLHDHPVFWNVVNKVCLKNIRDSPHSSCTHSIRAWVGHLY